MRDAASLRRSLAAAGDMAADAARTRSAGLRPTAARACQGSAWRCAARTLHCTKLRQQGEAPELERCAVQLARGVAGTSSPATNTRDRVRLTIHFAEHRSSGSDDDPSASEGRGTPHDTTEGLDQDLLLWSDHSDPYHTSPTRTAASEGGHASSRPLTRGRWPSPRPHRTATHALAAVQLSDFYRIILIRTSVLK